MPVTRIKYKRLKRALPHRCRACWARRTLSMMVSEYVRPPKCRKCGATKMFFCKDRVASRHGRKLKCNCGGYHFPHRKGSKHCHENPNVEAHWLERAQA